MGRCVTDVTTASRTSLMNLQTLNWDAELCDRFGVPIETLPEILSTHDEYGDVKIGGRDIPLRASVVDQQAALYGHGCHQPGEAKITLDTKMKTLNNRSRNKGFTLIEILVVMAIIAMLAEIGRAHV